MPAAEVQEQEAEEADSDQARGELRVAARRGTAFTVGLFASAIVQFAFLTLITHTIDQKEAGALFEAMAVFTICSNAAELGADSGLLRLLPIYRRRRAQDVRRLALVALVPALVVSCLAALAVFLFADQLTNVFVHHAPRASSADDLRILALFLPASTVSTVVCAGLLSWSAKQSVALNSFFTPFTRPVLFAGFMIVGVTPELAALAWALPLGATCVASAVLLARKVRRSPASRESTGYWVQMWPASFGRIAKEFWLFSLPRTFGAIFQILVTYFDVLLVGAYMATKYAAAYSVASRYVLLSTFALQAVGNAVPTQLSRLMDARSYGRVRQVYASTTWWTIAFSWPPLLVLAVFGPLFLSVFGPGYGVASTALAVLALSMLANIGTGPNGVLLLMAGRSRLNLTLQAVGLVTNIVLNLLLIPRIGLLGAAIAWAVTILLTSGLASAMLWRQIGIEPFGKGYAVVAGAALGCFGVLGALTRATLGVGLLPFAGFAVVSCSLYGVILWKSRGVLNLDAFMATFGRFGKQLRRFRRDSPAAKVRV
ncbi:MAG: polysaccharide biosynthesis C-terminal domain-containing protein [Acidimicrobiales bacterium]